MNTRFIRIAEPMLPRLKDVETALAGIWSRKYLTNDGPVLRDFEQKLMSYLGVENLTVQNNGHNSLEVGLRALGVSGEVITTPYSFVSTSLAIRNVGADVVFADIVDGGVNIDPERIREKVSEKTTAILAVHAYGLPCEMEAIQRVADDHGIALIYDGAHAFGVKYKNFPIASFGDASMFSFHATKLFNSIEGGALITNTSTTMEVARKIRNFGISGPDQIAGEGTNAKMNEILAAIGLLNLERVDIEINRRSVISEVYCEKFLDVEGVKVLEVPPGVEWNYSYFPVFFDNSISRYSTVEIEQFLNEVGIVSRRYFSVSLNTIDIFRGCDGAYDCSNSERLSESVLCLPIHGGMTAEDAEFVADNLVSLVGSS